MSTFHDDKLWQGAYLASLDVLDVVASLETADVLVHIKNHALTVLTVTADALSRTDRKEREEKMRNVKGLTLATRSLLSVAWAQELLEDDEFGKLDSQYEELGKLLK